MVDNPLANLDLRLVDSIEEAMNLKRWLGERRETPLGLDTESGGLSPWKDRLRLVQVGDLHTGWVIPCPHWGGVWEEIARDYTDEWVLHNSAYDAKVLKLHTGFDMPWERTHDTMTLASLDNPLRKRDLKGLASKIVDKSAATGQHVMKDAMAKRGWTWDTIPLEYEPYIFYSALDPVLACHMWKYLHPRVMASCPANYDLERATLRIVTSMMMAGLRLDLPYMQAKRREFLQREEDGLAWLKEAHGIASVNSARQLATAFERLGESITEYTATGLPQFTQEILQGFEASGENRAVRDLARIVAAVRNVHKMGTTYLDNFEEMAVDGILHCSINPMQARTSRMSTSEPNLQNLPRDEKAIRGSFIPREGCAFISCDADQIEARLAAHFGEDQGLIQAFHDADQPGAPDFFTVVARQLYQDSSITKKDLRRQLTKTYTYAKIYGSGLSRLARSTGATLDQVTALSQEFQRQFPGLDRIMQQTTAQAKAQHRAGLRPFVTTLMGRPLPGEVGREYALLNYLIQGSAAEALKRGMVELEAAGLRDYMRLPVHDEVLMEVPRHDAEEVLRQAAAILTDRDSYRVPITWSGDILTERWAKV